MIYVDSYLLALCLIVLVNLGFAAGFVVGRDW